MLYLGYMLARVVASLLPIRAAYWMAERVADVWYLSSPAIREAVAYNMSLLRGRAAGGAGETAGEAGRGSGEAMGETRAGSVAAHTRRTMRNFARVVTEFLYLPRLGPGDLRDLVDLESFSELKRKMAGRPAILVTAHIGNWELAAVAIAVSGVDLHVVVYDHPDRRVARLFRQHRQAKGLKVMSVKGAARSIMRVLRTGSVGIVGDRDYSGQGTEARFLGVTVSVPTAYAGLAVSMKVPVMAGFCIRGEDGKYRLALEQTVYDPARDRMTPEEIVQACLLIFEKGVENHPEQWYFFERVDRRWGSPSRKYRQSDRRQVKGSEKP